MCPRAIQTFEMLDSGMSASSHDRDEFQDAVDLRVGGTASCTSCG